MDELIRCFRTTQMELGVGERGEGDHRAFFVLSRVRGENAWDTHCGPYSTRDQAVWWIEQIREADRA